MFLFVWLGLEVSRTSFPAFSRSSLRQAISMPQRDWIDRAAGRHAHVAILWTGNGNALSFWENEIFNRSVRRVYHLDRALPGGMPETKVQIERTTGRIRGLGERWVLTDPTVELVGRRAAVDSRRGLVLWRTSGAARTTAQITGLWTNDVWSTRRVEYRRLACRGGTLTLTLRSDPHLFKHGQRVTVSTGEVVPLVGAHPERSLRIPLVSRGGVCAVAFDVARTAVPAEQIAGSTDRRALGVRFENVKYHAP
jgi:hypothetical protein